MNHISLNITKSFKNKTKITPMVVFLKNLNFTKKLFQIVIMWAVKEVNRYLTFRFLWVIPSFFVPFYKDINLPIALRHITLE